MSKVIKKRRQRVNMLLLRARLVDRHGRLLRPEVVETIDFVAASINTRTGEKRALDLRALDPSEVVLGGLQNDAEWSVDACGYNFWHLIDVNTFRFPLRTRHGEFCYAIRDTSGVVSILRFQIGGEEHDRN